MVLIKICSVFRNGCMLNVTFIFSVTYLTTHLCDLILNNGLAYRPQSMLPLSHSTFLQVFFAAAAAGTHPPLLCKLPSPEDTNRIARKGQVSPCHCPSLLSHGTKQGRATQPLTPDVNLQPAMTPGTLPPRSCRESTPSALLALSS